MVVFQSYSYWPEFNNKVLIYKVPSVNRCTFFQLTLITCSIQNTASTQLSRAMLLVSQLILSRIHKTIPILGGIAEVVVRKPTEEETGRDILAFFFFPERFFGQHHLHFLSSCEAQINHSPAMTEGWLIKYFHMTILLSFALSAKWLRKLFGKCMFFHPIYPIHFFETLSSWADYLVVSTEKREADSKTTRWQHHRSVSPWPLVDIDCTALRKNKFLQNHFLLITTDLHLKQLGRHRKTRIMLSFWESAPFWIFLRPMSNAT